MAETKKIITKDDFLTGSKFIQKYGLNMTSAELAKRIQTLKGVTIPGNPRVTYVVWNRASHDKNCNFLIHPLAEEELLKKLTTKGK